MDGLLGVARGAGGRDCQLHMRPSTACSFLSYVCMSLAGDGMSCVFMGHNNTLQHFVQSSDCAFCPAEPETVSMEEEHMLTGAQHCASG